MSVLPCNPGLWRLVEGCCPRTRLNAFRFSQQIKGFSSIFLFFLTYPQLHFINHFWLSLYLFRVVSQSKVSFARTFRSHLHSFTDLHAEASQFDEFASADNCRWTQLRPPCTRVRVTLICVNMAGRSPQVNPVRISKLGPFKQNRASPQSVAALQSSESLRSGFTNMFTEIRWILCNLFSLLLFAASCPIFLVDCTWEWISLIQIGVTTDRDGTLPNARLTSEPKFKWLNHPLIKIYYDH